MRQDLEIQVGTGIFADYIGNRVAFGDGLGGRVYQNGEPLIVPNYSQWVGRLGAYERLSVGAAVAVPLMAGKERVGVLGLAHLEPQLIFTNEDLALLMRFADLAAVALDNERLYTSAQQEIEERRRTQAELEEARDAAEAANRAKSAFLANMSHELRTPLNAIIGYSEMLQEDAEDLGYDDFVPDLDKIRSAGSHLLDLINNILDLSKIEAGRMELYIETFDVENMLNVVVTTIHPLLQKNSNQFALEVEPAVGEMATDLTKVRQVLFNLLSNAAKFTENGTVTLSAQYDTPDWIVFRVADTGIGMDQSQLDEVFKEFTQADASTTRRYGGTGLGLAICYRFCEMMGGTLSVTSAVGAGSIFTVRLPTIVSQHTTAHTTPTDEERATATGIFDPSGVFKGTMLVIDDDPIVRDIVVRFMTRDGFRVLAAADGEEGIRIAKAERPDVITLDVLMPGIDGWVVLEVLKNDPETSL